MWYQIPLERPVVPYSKHYCCALLRLLAVVRRANVLLLRRRGKCIWYVPSLCYIVFHCCTPVAFSFLIFPDAPSVSRSVKQQYSTTGIRCETNLFFGTHPNQTVFRFFICRYTPLHWASQKGHTHTVQALLAAGASVHVVSNPSGRKQGRKGKGTN